MAFLPDDQATRIRCYEHVLGQWRVDGYIEFEHERHVHWLRSEFEQYSLREIKRKMFEYVQNGGRISETVETREEFVSYQFHYDLRFPIDGRHVYFETVLVCDDPTDLDSYVIQVKNVKDV